MTTGTDALTERIARTLTVALGCEGTMIDVPEGDAIWCTTHDNGMNNGEWCREVDYAATAVLPIVEAEVRAAKVEALREAADSVHDNGASPYCLPCHRDDAELLHTIAAEYETGDQA